MFWQSKHVVTTTHIIWLFIYLVFQLLWFCFSFQSVLWFWFCWWQLYDVCLVSTCLSSSWFSQWALTVRTESVHDVWGGLDHSVSPGEWLPDRCRPLPQGILHTACWRWCCTQVTNADTDPEAPEEPRPPGECQGENLRETDRWRDRWRDRQLFVLMFVCLDICLSWCLRV